MSLSGTLIISRKVTQLPTLCGKDSAELEFSHGSEIITVLLLLVGQGGVCCIGKIRSPWQESI